MGVHRVRHIALLIGLCLLLSLACLQGADLSTEQEEVVPSVDISSDGEIAFQKLYDYPAEENDFVLQVLAAGDPQYAQVIAWAQRAGHLASDAEAGQATIIDVDDLTSFFAVSYGGDGPPEERVIAFQIQHVDPATEEGTHSPTTLARLEGDAEDARLVLFNQTFEMVITTDGIDEEASRSFHVSPPVASLLPVQQANGCTDGPVQDYILCAERNQTVRLPRGVCIESLRTLANAWRHDFDGSVVPPALLGVVAGCGSVSLYCFAHMLDDPPVGVEGSMEYIEEGEIGSCSEDGSAVILKPTFMVEINWYDDRRPFPDDGTQTYQLAGGQTITLNSTDCGGNVGELVVRTPNFPEPVVQTCAENETCTLEGERGAACTEAAEVPPPPVDDATVTSCLASPDMYRAEFVNKNNNGSNESKSVCQGDFVLENRSTDGANLTFHYYRVSENGATKRERWDMLGLNPGESIILYFGRQTFTSGREPNTVETYSKVVVRLSAPECFLLFTAENVENWQTHAVTLTDPCSE